MLLHYLGKLKSQIFCRCGRKHKQIAFKNRPFVIHRQILIFSEFKIANISAVLIVNKIFHVTVLLHIYFCEQFVTPEIRHSRRHCTVCQQWKRDFDKSLYLKRYIAKRLTDEFPEKAGQNVVLINCSESCTTQAQLTGGQAAADCSVPALKKTLRQLTVLSWVKRTSRRPRELSMRYHGRRVFIGRLCPGLFVRICTWNASRSTVRIGADRSELRCLHGAC